jgi:phosphoglycolate phosphatase-like HAD superfamily hydrolase
VLIQINSPNNKILSMKKRGYAKSLNNYSIVFWDFDGVIKLSVDIKTNAFIQLFEGSEAVVLEKIRSHHLKNGGMSRFDKIPLYARWAGVDLNPSMLQSYIDEFSRIALNSVVSSEWVPGVVQYLHSNYRLQDFYLISATPQEEINLITKQLEIHGLFKQIFGFPTIKTLAVSQVLKKSDKDKVNSVFIGDALIDCEAAESNGIDFIFRGKLSDISWFPKNSIRVMENFLDQ